MTVLDLNNKITKQELSLGRVTTRIVPSGEDRTRRQRHWLADLNENAPFQPFDDGAIGERVEVWKPPIPKATWIGEAIEAGVGLDEWGTPVATVIAEIYDGYLTKMLAAASGGGY
jgi:hypothetical protein